MMVAPSNDICEISFVTTMGTQSRLDSMQKVIIYNVLWINVAKTEHMSTREYSVQMKLN